MNAAVRSLVARCLGRDAPRVLAVDRAWLDAADGWIGAAADWWLDQCDDVFDVLVSQARHLTPRLRAEVVAMIREKNAARPEVDLDSVGCGFTNMCVGYTHFEDVTERWDSVDECVGGWRRDSVDECVGGWRWQLNGTYDLYTDFQVRGATLRVEIDGRPTDWKVAPMRGLGFFKLSVLLVGTPPFDVSYRRYYSVPYLQVRAGEALKVGNRLCIAGITNPELDLEQRRAKWWIFKHYAIHAFGHGWRAPSCFCHDRRPCLECRISGPPDSIRR